MAAIPSNMLEAFARLETNPDFVVVLSLLESRYADALAGLQVAADLRSVGDYQGKCAAYGEVLEIARNARSNLKTRQGGGTTQNAF